MGRHGCFAKGPARETPVEWQVMCSVADGEPPIDGHTRVYHGSLTKTPRRHVMPGV